MITGYNLYDTHENIVKQMQKNNDRVQDCFEELATISNRVEVLLELALDYIENDIVRDSFLELLYAIHEYSYEMKVISNAFVDACDVKLNLVNK